ncbi:hypothetical protein K491DRAFT_243183 [Lophiostoma macrostomum CBS 122681]|uniref:Fungal STAND N-terminal Goodbye domain-containing protein n=1 Tax=Lophiostoma macrostomum CBS 122681 TaxID=1314788 RepID=A0A6A6SKU1_9PLEO|nr:hypothetical protein K491DRAFT_243183 [Lophiostoma macrostomum CBS 122681]
MATLTLLDRANSELSTEDRKLVKRSTADFINEHVTQPHELGSPIFRTDSGFVTEDQSNTHDKLQSEIWAEAFREAQNLALILEQSQGKLKNHDPKFKPISSGNFTLSELTAAIETHKCRYELEDLRGSRGFLRKGFRKLSENAQSFRQWLDLVPNSSYSAPIVGALVVMLAMADRMHKVREEIFKMMVAVPEEFNELRDYLSVYSEVSDETLSRKAADVCTNISRTLQQAMKFMGDNPFKKVLKSLKGDSYEKVTLDCIEKLAESKKQFRGAIDKHLHSRVGNLFRLAKSSSMLQKMIAWEVLQSRETTLAAINSSHQDLKAELSELRNVVNNAMYNKLLSDEDERGYLAQMAAKKLLEADAQNSMPTNSCLPVSEMVIPHFDAKRTRLDILTCLAQGSSLSSLEVGRLTCIKHDSVFRKWILESTTSSAIHCDANADVGPADYISTTSFLCAEAAHLLEPVKRTVVLSYFCGLRAAPASGTRAGAKDLITSLLGQLLEYQTAGLFRHASIDNRLWESPKSRKPSGLCETFKALILQLPEDWSVVCFIDGIEFYETLLRVEGTVEVIRFLLKLVRKLEKRGGPALKLMVAATKMSLVIGKEFGPAKRIVCSEDPVEESILPADVVAGEILRST